MWGDWDAKADWHACDKDLIDTSKGHVRSINNMGHCANCQAHKQDIAERKSNAWEWSGLKTNCGNASSLIREALAQKGVKHKLFKFQSDCVLRTSVPQAASLLPVSQQHVLSCIESCVNI